MTDSYDELFDQKKSYRISNFVTNRYPLINFTQKNSKLILNIGEKAVSKHTVNLFGRSVLFMGKIINDKFNNSHCIIVYNDNLTLTIRNISNRNRDFEYGIIKFLQE